LPKSSAKLKSSRSNGERRQWAAAVVKKATPRIVKSLIDAAASVEEVPSSKTVARTPGEEEDEALAAILLRMLRPPDASEKNGTENPAPQPAAPGSENPSVG